MKEKLLKLVSTWRGLTASLEAANVLYRCAAELEELALSIPDQVPVTRERVLAVLSNMQSVMCGAALDGREKTADAILALLNTPPQDWGVTRDKVHEAISNPFFRDDNSSNENCAHIEEAVNAILALLNQTPHAGSDIKAEWPIGQDVVNIRQIAKHSGGVIIPGAWGLVVDHTAHGPIEVKFGCDDESHLFDSPADWVAKVRYD